MKFRELFESELMQDVASELGRNGVSFEYNKSKDKIFVYTNKKDFKEIIKKKYFYLRYKYVESMGNIVDYEPKGQQIHFKTNLGYKVIATNDRNEIILMISH